MDISHTWFFHCIKCSCNYSDNVRQALYLQPGILTELVWVICPHSKCSSGLKLLFNAAVMIKVAEIYIMHYARGASLAVQWLRLCTSTVRRAGLISGGEISTHMQCSQKKKAINFTHTHTKKHFARACQRGLEMITQLIGGPHFLGIHLESGNCIQPHRPQWPLGRRITCPFISKWVKWKDSFQLWENA